MQVLMRLLDIPLANVHGELEEILSLHKTALAYRPNWPFSWANVALTKSMLHQLDDEFDQALNRVMIHGPYESGVLLRVISTGIGNWSALSAGSRELIYQAVANSVELSSGTARNIRRQLERKEVVKEFCNQVPFHSERGHSLVCE